MKETLAERINQRQSELGLKDAELERLAGLPQGSLAKTKKARSPGVERVDTLARALRVEFKWLATGHGPKLLPDEDACSDVAAIIMTTLLDRIEQRLRDLDLAATTAAEKAGLDRTWIIDLRRGRKRGGSNEAILRLAEVLQCNPLWLA